MIGTGLFCATMRLGGMFNVKEAATGRARRLHHVFGDVLPDSTTDDRPDARDDEEPYARDRWLRDNRPPHHDPGP